MSDCDPILPLSLPLRLPHPVENEEEEEALKYVA
jgi:hypothetical protein